MKDMRFKPYFDTDFLRIRDFLSSSSALERPNRRPWNWWIDRWNFTPLVSRAMHAMPHDMWAATIGLWERTDDGSIAGLVLSEGEGRGERFIQSGNGELPEGVLEEMFDFIERTTADDRPVHLRIDPRFPAREAMAAARGYARIDWSEPLSWLGIDDAPPPDLAEGYRLARPGELDAYGKALLHARAFGHADKAEYVRRNCANAFSRLPLAPDYRAELDIAAVGHGDDPAAFAGFWYDKGNSWGILEPLGTAPEHRRRGLARSLIGEGARRLASVAEREGGKLEGIWVGSDQEFYLAIGFRVMNRWGVWRKE